MAYKEELKDKALSLSIELKGNENIKELEEKISEVDTTFIPKNNEKEDPQKEQMVPLSTVQKMIEEAMARMPEANKPLKLKKVTEHMAHVWRLNGKWVVDFANKNFNYKENKVIDPYIKDKIHAYTKYNPEKRENESWITLIYQDGTTEDLPLNRYVERRTLVYCTIIKREKVDKSYVVGEVEKKKEGKDGMNVGTGVIVDQEVEMYQEIFHVKTPDGELLDLPDYVIC